MFKNRPSFRFALVASALIALAAITATATRSTPFAFLDSVQEFFGMASVTTPTRTVAPMRQLAETTNFLAPAPQPMFFAPGPVPFNGTTYTQDFQSMTTGTNTVAVTGGTMTEISSLTGGGTLDGWYMYGLGWTTPALTNKWIAGDTGSSNAGGFRGMIDTQPTVGRGLGSTGSGSATGFYGIVLRNTSGATINSVNISFDAIINRNPQSNTNATLFQYRTSAANVVTTTSTADGTFSNSAGSWITSAALSFGTPASGTGAPGTQAAINPIFKISTRSSLESLIWANNDYLYLRFSETDETGGDATVGIDNFSISAPAATGTGIFSSPSTTTFGGSTTISATTRTAIGAAIPTHGTITIYDGPGCTGPILAIGSLFGGNDTVSTNTSSLSVGSHSLSACYTDGGSAYLDSMSTNFTHTVNPPPPTPPVASFTVNPNPSACNQSITFNGSASTATSPATITNYAWDFGDTGTASGASPTVSHAYTAYGTYTVQLTVTDSNNLTHSTSTSVNVNQGNQAPVANAGGPYIVGAGSNVELNGTGSSDPNASCGDSIVSYTWDMDNDGSYDDEIGATLTITPAQLTGYGIPVGITRTIGLRVTDEFGVHGVVSTTITRAAPTTVVSLTRAHPNPTNLSDVIFTVEFAAAVDGVTTSNFALVNGGLTAPSITSVNPQGSAPNTKWNISVNTGTGSGTLGLNLANATGVTPGVSTTLPYVGDVYTIDRDAPAAPVITGTTPSSPSNSSITPTINGTAETNSNVELYTSSDCVAGSLGSGLATSGNFAIGINVVANAATPVYAKSTDSAGNASACSGGITYIHDNIPAVTTIDSTPPASTSSTSATFTFSGSQSLSEGAEVDAPEAVSFTFECQLDSGGYTACTSPQNYTGLSVAHHIFNVRAIDPAGNADTTPAVYEWDVVAPVCYPAPSGMISWFKGENNGNDYLGNNNASPIGGPTFGAGKVGQAFDFTAGGQTFEAPDSPSLDLTTQFTFDAWINPSANHGPGLAGGSVVAKVGGGINNGYQFGITDNNSAVFCQFNATGEPWPTNQLVATVPGGIPMNAWTHIACTYDNADLKVYANGVLIGTQNIGPKSVVNSASPLRISGDSNNNVYFTGKIDEVEIFNRALAGTEVQGIYDAGSLGKCDFTCTQAPGGMINWWKGEGTGIDAILAGTPITATGTATFTSAGGAKVGGGLLFDGTPNSYFSAGTSAGNFGTSDFTVDAWVKTTSTRMESILGKRGCNVGGVPVLELRHFPNGTLVAEFAGSSVVTNSIISTRSINDGVFHHLALRRAGNNFELYIDGTLEGSTSSAGGINFTNGYPFAIGGASCADAGVDSTLSFTGVIDEVELFNTAIAPADIAGIYNASSAGKCDITCATPPANMTAWFKGNGNAHEVFGSHGALVGNATATASGMVGQAFGFDGSGDYVTTPDNGKWDLTGDFTIDAWINPVDGVGTERIVSAGNENQGAFNLWTLGYGDNAAWGGGQRLNFAYWAPGYVDINSNAITLSPGRWYHVAFVRSGGTYTYYLDGVAVGSGSMTTAALNGGTTGAIIGARYDQFLGIAEFANGKLDEIEIFNNDLSPSEIQSIYTANFAGKCYAPGSVEFTAANFDDTELNSGSHTATVTVTRTGGSYGTAAVAYTTGDGTATLADDDYELSSGTVTWADGEAGPKNILVTVNGDTNFEGNETINMSFTTVYNAATGPQSTSTVTILNDDANPPTVTATSPADAAAGVLRNTSVAVTFSQAMNPATITTQAATGACSGSLQVSSDNFATCIGLGVPAASGGNTVFTATPTALLEGTTTYKIRVTADAQNAGGTPATPYTQATGFTTVGKPNYDVTTTASSITVTENTSNNDTINITEPSAGNIRFAEGGGTRTFSLNGATAITGNSGDLSLSGITSVTFNAQGGHDTTTVGAFSGTSFPSLTVNGGQGNDRLDLNGNITFASNASFDGDMTNDDASPGNDDFAVISNADLIFSGTGAFTLKVSKYIQILGTGSVDGVGSTIRTVNGNILMESNQLGGGSGEFRGIYVDDSIVEATGTGTTTLKGRGGVGGGTNVGIGMRNFATVKGGTTGAATSLTGNGGSGTNTHGLEIGLDSTISSNGGNVSVTGTAGSGAGTSLGFILFPTGIISTTGNGSIVVSGTGGTGGSGNDGIRIDGSLSKIAAAGSGTVTVTATGGAGDSPGLNLSRSGSVTAVSGTVSITGTHGGNGTGIFLDSASSGNPIISTVNQPIELIADKMNFLAGSVSPGNNTANLRAQTGSRTIELGGADSPTVLGLADGELDRCAISGTLTIGAVGASGPVNVVAGSTITQARTMNILSPVTTTVASTGDLGMFGTLAGPLTVSSGGILRPGSSPGVINSGAVTMNATSVFNVELGGTTPGNGAGNHDQVNATGAFAAGGTLNVALSGGFVPAFANTFTIATSTGSTSGTFSTVNWPAGYTGTITYNANSIVLSGIVAPPTVTNVVPSSGLTTGGESVTVNGTNFTGATSVTFDGLPCAIGAITSTTITCTTPAHAAGPVDVAVTTPGGTATGTGVYTYVKANTALSDLTVVSTALVGNSISVSTTLTRTTAPAGPISGANVIFTLTDPSSGITNHPGTTNGSGVATVLIPMTQRGVHTLVANYAGTADLNSATSNTPSVTVYQRTQLSYSGGSGIVGTPITLTATLTRVPGGAAVPDETVVFGFGGVIPPQTAQTNTSGVASVDVTFPSSGTFSSTTSFSNLAAFYVDASGNQVPTTATANVVVGAETAVAISSGALTISDDNGGVSADTITLSCNSSNLRINDPGRSIAAGPGTTQVDANTVDVSLVGLTSITVNTLAGNDILNVDLTGCDIIPSGGLTFNGGDPISGLGDKLNIIGGSATTQTFNFTNEHDGNVVLAGSTVAGTISYTGLEPVSSTVTAANVVLNYSAVTETISVSQNGGTPAQTLVDSNVGGESVSFVNPTTSLEINGGDTGDDTIDVNGFGTSTGGFNAGLTINGGTGNDTVNLNTNITFATGNSLDVDLINDNASPGVDTINVGTSASLQLSGSGTATLNASRNVTTGSSSSVTTANGNVTITANPAGTTTGAFTGVAISGTVEATGSGKVTVAGKGGDSGASKYGVVVSGGIVRGGTGPGVKTEVTGTGASNAAIGAHGVFVNDFSSITSIGGDVLVTGTGGAGGGGTDNYGVIVFGTNGVITSGGTGAVTVNGFGGSAASKNFGVIPHSGGTITSGGSGAVIVNGTGGPGVLGVGVEIFRNGKITSGGGTVNVTGTSPGSDGVLLTTDVVDALITSGGGAVTVTGVPGPGAIGIFLNQSVGGQSRISSGSNANITLIADSMLLDNGNTAVDAGLGAVTLRQFTNAIGIDLGGADSATSLGLTDAELDKVTAATINIGDANTGDITTLAPITRAAATAVNLTSGASVNVQAGQIDSGGGNITASPNAAAFLFVGNPGVDATTGAASTFKLASGRTLRLFITTPVVDTGYFQLNVAGKVDITGTSLVFGGGSTATPLASYKIIDNDGTADAITGEFTGLPDEFVITNFLGSGLDARIDYQGGDGNDCVITMLAPVPEIQFSAPQFYEDESQTAVITITRSGDLTNPSSVSFNTAGGGSATGGATCTGAVDYVVPGSPLPRTINFGTNVSTQTVLIDICGETTSETTDTLNLSLSGATNANLGTQTTAVLNINDTASQFLSVIPHQPIDMTLGSPATPYPSQIVVAGAPNIIGGMRVTLYDIWHDNPDNIDVLLVGPQGQKYVLMADVGGPFVIGQGAPVTLTFSDAATAVLDDSAMLATGKFRPTSCETPVLSFFGPAPAGPYVEPGCTLARPPSKTLFGTPPTGFGMTNPNGTWRLFVRDDNGSLRPVEAAQTTVGSISGGWGLEFLAPTAADVSIGGRVLTGEGRGIRGARVTVTGNSLASPIIVTTGVNGRYTVPGLTAGETYVVTVSARRFFFEAPSRVITLNDNVTDADFISTPTTTREQ